MQIWMIPWMVSPSLETLAIIARVCPMPGCWSWLVPLRVSLVPLLHSSCSCSLDAMIKWVQHSLPIVFPQISYPDSYHHNKCMSYCIGRIAGFILFIGGILYVAGWIWEVVEERNFYVDAAIWDLLSDDTKTQLESQCWVYTTNDNHKMNRFRLSRNTPKLHSNYRFCCFCIWWDVLISSKFGCEMESI